MTRSAGKNTKSEHFEPNVSKRDRSDYISDLPAENPRVVGINQPISSAPETPVKKVDQSVATEDDEDDTDVTPQFVYDPPWQKDLVRDERLYFSLVTVQVSFSRATASESIMHLTNMFPFLHP